MVSGCVMLARRGDLDELRARANARDELAGLGAARLLAELLAESGDLDELRARADAGDGDAAAWLAGCWPSAGPGRAASPRPPATDAAHLAALLAERGDLDQAVQICAPAPTPAAGTPPATWPSASRARGPGRAARRRRRRRRVRHRGAGRSAGRPRGPGRGRAGPARQGQRRRLGRRLAAGWTASSALAQRRQGEEAERLLSFGLNPDGSIASG